MTEGPQDDRIAQLERRVSTLEDKLAGENSPVAGRSKPLSIQEYLAASRPKSDVEKTLRIAFFVETHTGIAPFNINDLKQAFAQARVPLPSNVNDAINKNIQKSFIMEVEERRGGLKSWVLTNSGEEYVTGKSDVRVK